VLVMRLGDSRNRFRASAYATFFCKPDETSPCPKEGPLTCCGRYPSYACGRSLRRAPFRMVGAFCEQPTTCEGYAGALPQPGLVSHPLSAVFQWFARKLPGAGSTS
jgi:hypothetical protein